MEATPPAAPTSRGRPPTNHTSRIRSKRPQPVIVAKLNCEEQLRLPAETHASPQRMKTLAETQTTAEGGGCRAPSLPSCVPYTAAPTSRCKTHLHASTESRETRASTQETSKPRRSPNTTPSTRELQQHRRRHTSTMDRVFTHGRRH